jgi:cytochrome c peroxidase
MGKAQCGTCHFAPNFSGLVPPLYTENESEVLGVPEDPNAAVKKADADNGRYSNKLYSEMAWIYEKSFKTVTVRNAALTAPYFHNGSYKTLKQVVDFYNNGGGAGMGLNIKNQTLAADSLHLSDGEKKSLVAFMQSLNDTGK